MKHFFKSFSAFYPEYLAAHSNSTNMKLHFVGATLFYIMLFLSIAFLNIYLLIFAVFAGYILPHIGHTTFQKNKSMRGSNPVFCVLGATRLYFETWKKFLKFD